MCGITGVVGPRASDGDHQHAVHEALARIRHRGPDGGGVHSLKLKWTDATLGQVRLAIVDKRPIEVPYVYEGGDLVLAYNGEIYNHGELRAELEDGHPWETRCDAEVLARAWRRWGHECLTRLNGMFAFCIVDAKTQSVFLARDRAGEKPLYWTLRDGHFFFASEIKGLGCGPLEETRCLDMEIFEFDCLRETPFKGVYALEPGHCIDLGGATDLRWRQPTPHRWWAPPQEVDAGMGWDEACGRAEALIVSAVRLRAQAEVPVTAYVSGGLDSAIIQAVLQKDRHSASEPEVFVYDAEYEEQGEMSESVHLATLAVGHFNARVIVFPKHEAEDALPQIAWYLDTPATWSAVAHWFLARRVAESPAKIILTGEGADELFAGYTRYKILWWLEQAKKDPTLFKYGPLFNHMLDGNESDLLYRLFDHTENDSAALYARLMEIIKTYGGGGSLVERAARIDWHTTMQVLLRMADLMTMAFGLENRSPFLDHRLVELAFRMPVEHKIGLDGTKRVLREVARRLGVDDRITNNPTKAGMFVPWNQWFGEVSGSRGVYDRKHFFTTLKTEWRKAWRARGHDMVTG